MEQTNQQAAGNAMIDRAKLEMLRTDFMKALAHDVRNPLHTMMIYSECMLDDLYGELSEEQAEAIREIASAAKLMTVLVNNVFALDDWHRGDVKPCHSDFDLIGMVKGVIEAATPKAETLNVSIAMQTMNDAMPVRADRDQVQQKVHNVLSTVVRATEGREIVVSMEQRGMDAVIAVIDPSMKLTEEEMESVMGDPWEGDGGRFGSRILGIAMAKAFCEGHRGRFHVSSDEGTRFEMCIPR